MVKVSIYARESSDDIKKAPPIEKQIQVGKDWIEQNGYGLVDIYADNGYSGGNWKRPDWNKSVKGARRHSYTVLWVWDQDRIARDTEQFLWYCRNLKDAHVKIFEHTSSSFIDMDTLGGRVKHQTMAQAAEIFRLVTSEKVKKAYQQKMKRGESWGRPKKKFDTDKAEALKAQGLGWRKISESLDEKVSYQTIRRYFLGKE